MGGDKMKETIIPNLILEGKNTVAWTQED